MYKFGNIIKKTFVYVYAMLSSYDDEEKMRLIFMTLEKKMSDDGALNSRELFKEFKNRNLVNRENMKAFSFIDPNKSRRMKKLLSDHNHSKISNNNSAINKREIIAKDWGTIPYTVFLCFFYLEEFANAKKDCYKAREKYIFDLMSNQEQKNNMIENELIRIEEELKKQEKKPEEIHEILKYKEQRLIEKNQFYITKHSYSRFIYKYFLPFIDEKEEIEKLFTQYPEKIMFEDFVKLIE